MELQVVHAAVAVLVQQVDRGVQLALVELRAQAARQARELLDVQVACDSRRLGGRGSGPPFLLPWRAGCS